MFLLSSISDMSDKGKKKKKKAGEWEEGRKERRSFYLYKSINPEDRAVIWYEISQYLENSSGRFSIPLNKVLTMAQFIVKNPVFFCHALRETSSAFFPREHATGSYMKNYFSLLGTYLFLAFLDTLLLPLVPNNTFLSHLKDRET